ncbi:hypothetical protein OAG85_02740 [Verrucomicrobiales bacterium]|nr:hypothetical protein [Verrucomicrobiales bacterium]
MRVSCRSLKGFTLPEVLVAGAMSAAFMTAAALSFQAVTYNQQRYQGLVSVTVNPGGGLAGAVGNFYPNLTGQPILNVYGSPAYGRAAAAQNVYDRFWEDVEKASAVFCLSRNGQLNVAGTPPGNLMRPKELPFPVGLTFTDVDSHSAFLLDVLIPYNSAASTIYTDYRNVSPIPLGADPIHVGGSVYVIQPYDITGELGVRAIYEIDLIKISSPVGVYASVRRYVKNVIAGSDLSDYYDVFYEDAKVTDFGPLFVAFEKSSRLALPETATADEDSYGVTADAYKVGPRAPFTFMWWPDPALMLGKDGGELVGNAAALSAGDVRASYYEMGAKTSLMSVVPIFPSL